MCLPCLYQQLRVLCPEEDPVALVHLPQPEDEALLRPEVEGISSHEEEAAQSLVVQLVATLPLVVAVEATGT
jgi:hypothetical protein